MKIRQGIGLKRVPVTEFRFSRARANVKQGDHARCERKASLRSNHRWISGKKEFKRTGTLGQIAHKTHIFTGI